MILLLTLPLFGFGLVWGIRPLLSPQPGREKGRFTLADMYALVLQIAVTGALLSRAFKSDHDRFLFALIASVLILTLIWGCILSALNERGVTHSLQRFAVFILAPVHILTSLAYLLATVVFEDSRVVSVWSGLFKLMLVWLCVVLFARWVFSWAVRQPAA